MWLPGQSACGPGAWQGSGVFAGRLCYFESPFCFDFTLDLNAGFALSGAMNLALGETPLPIQLLSSPASASLGSVTIDLMSIGRKIRLTTLATCAG